MAQDSNILTVGSVDAEVIRGWNAKLDMNNLQLSSLSPFVNLLGLYTNVEKDGVKSDIDVITSGLDQVTKSDFLDNLFNIKINVNSGTNLPNGFHENMKAMVLADIRPQLYTYNRKGGVGIESLSIVRGVKDSLNVKYELSMVVTDTEIFNEQIEYSNLTNLNSKYMILYGWNPPRHSEEGLSFDSPPAFPLGGANTITVNIDDLHKGFWRAELCQLYKFDFGFSKNGMLQCNLGFMSPNNAVMAFYRLMNLSDRIKKKLGLVANNSEIMSITELKNSDNKRLSNIKNYIPNSITINTVIQESQTTNNTDTTAAISSISFEPYFAEMVEDRSLTQATFDRDKAANGYTIVDVLDINAKDNEYTAGSATQDPRDYYSQMYIRIHVYYLKGWDEALKVNYSGSTMPITIKFSVLEKLITDNIAEYNTFDDKIKSFYSKWYQYYRKVFNRSSGNKTRRN